MIPDRILRIFPLVSSSGEREEELYISHLLGGVSVSQQPGAPECRAPREPHGTGAPESPRVQGSQSRGAPESRSVAYLTSWVRCF